MAPRFVLLAPLLILGACITTAPPATDPVGATEPPADESPPLDTASPPAEEDPPAEDTAPAERAPGHVEEESIDAMDDPGGFLFDLSVMHTVAIRVSDEGIASLNADYETYVPADVEVDGYAVDNVGLRIKGMIGSLRTLSGKPSLKIDFNSFVEDQRFFGLEKLTLNNEVVDCSNMKEWLAYRVFALGGIPERRTAFAWVTLNGAPYGLYTLIETPDDVWLKRVYADPTGNLYDGNYMWYGGYSYTLLDFTTSQQDYYVLDEGTDVGLADVHAVTAAISDNWEADTMFEALGAVVDLEEFAREFAAEQWVGQDDGYSLNTNNYLLYFDPSDGKMDLLPWDLDYSFMYDWEWGMSWSRPKGVLAQACKRNDECRALMVTAMSELLDTLDASDLGTEFEQVAELTLPYAMTDPRRECSTAYIESERQELRTWGKTRSDQIRESWGL